MSAPSGAPSRLPPRLRKILPADTAAAWSSLGSILPPELYLGGGTAVAVHLEHRESRDLDFFFHQPVDLERLKKQIGGLGDFAITHQSRGTLKGLFGGTRIEVFDAGAIKQLAAPTDVAGLKVASLQDLMAMKIKVLAERGEMRDYFDVKTIDEDSPISVEEGIELYIERYGIAPADGTLLHLYKALGSLDDVEEDEALPTTKAELQKWWSHRQVQVLRNSDRFA